jgi:hypothetical protein
VLAGQRSSGAWVSDRQLYSTKHLATHWRLDLLADFGFTSDDEPVRKACGLFFAWQLPSGDFAIDLGRARGYPCATGRALCQFHRFGLGADPRLARAWGHLAGSQRADGGWHCRGQAMRPTARSCFLATLKVMEAGAASGSTVDARAAGPPQATDMDSLCYRAARFVHGCLMDPRIERYNSPTLWDRFVYPNHWYDAAGVVDLLAGFGYGPNDPAMQSAVDLILRSQNADGTWNQAAPLAWRGATPYPFGAVGEPSPWVTFRARRALTRVWRSDGR